eukprot:SAG22_NODE_21494_length_256_cov_1.286624_1_plen_53_part_01
MLFVPTSQLKPVFESAVLHRRFSWISTQDPVPSTRNLALDTGIPWISRMQILS